MRGNNFLPIDFGKRQKQIVNPNKNNRRVIHYSYNLINNIGEEDLSKKDNVNRVLNTSTRSSLVNPFATSGSQYDVYDRARAKQQESERKLSLPSTKNSASQRNGSQAIGLKKQSDNSQFASSRERKTNLNYLQTATNRPANKLEFETYSVYKSNGGGRYSDPLYEQRSLPPLPYATTNNSENSDKAGTTDVLGNAKISQISKSQNDLATTSSAGTAVRKDGISAVENQDIMHGKMRKKAVCDKTDDSHYQRQFLRVLNKRF